jgi:hypothetical protein
VTLDEARALVSDHEDAWNIHRVFMHSVCPGFTIKSDDYHKLSAAVAALIIALKGNEKTMSWHVGPWHPVCEQLKRLGCKPGMPIDGADVYFETHDFLLRLVEDEDGGNMKIQLACKEFFDRWGNSVHFEIEYDPAKQEKFNFVAAVEHARQIVKATVFDFNTYFYRIQLDGFRAKP